MVSFSFKLTYLLTALTGLTTANAHYGDEQPIASRKPVDPVTIKLPSGFSATVVAEDLGAARHIVVSKTGDIYIKLAKLKDGKGIIRLRDTNNDGTPDQRTSFGDYPGTGIFLKNGYLYTSSNSSIYRYKLNDKEEVINPEQPEKLVSGLRVKERDQSKSIAVDNQNNIYVNIASDNDACREPGTGKGMMPCPLLDSAAGIWKFKANVADQKFSDGSRYATGLKNVVGLDWNTKTNSLFVMQHGRGQFHDFYPQYYTPDQSAKLPAETMYEVHQGDNAGWPYTYYDHIQKKQFLAPEYGGDGKKTGDPSYIKPTAAFPAHLGPNGLLFYTGTAFPEKYRNGAFVAFHSQSAELKKGYFVAFVPFKNGKPSGNWEIFADNFAGTDLAKPTGPVQHRPCGLAQGPDGSLYVTDDMNGTLFRISYNGAARPTKTATSSTKK
ncbi:PQQ-dependent sugar dehydrogenase [Spirosoma sp. KUDC1026]|uniref:PQQ-dependent sugar dehydrogenase n=1 Tax=Spirosoma sp. KUDC1026 TaxID=2745947 RepID=UPI00159BA7AF|nr:PQQ-dependent sugar dehydrogenase [Spirosoma sp. KUDC1026]QKZ13126.1 PQQ-dependent sugar dehydrogenase [Spirosoma sp. KUDC1026]